MATSLTKTDFLRFSAYSIKDAITRKLSEDTRFTDQVFEGSNLAILIDIVSYMYQCLVYQLNTAASESMFADTLLYENITRLVKFIGYNPKGCTASSIPLYISNISGKTLRSYWIPPYARIDTGLSDSNGNKIYFSRDSEGSDDNYSTAYSIKENATQSITLYNGQWKMYLTIFTASGIDNETFTLAGLMSDSDKTKYVAHDFIDVYVGHFNATTQEFNKEKWIMDKNSIFVGYAADDGEDPKLFNNQTAFKSLYPGSYQVYSVALNDNKEYELKFGNGIVGKKLSPGDKVYVFYLETNGPDGKVDITDISTTNLKFDVHNAKQFGISDDLYNSIFKINDSRDRKYEEAKNLTEEENLELYALSFGLQTSTTPRLEETVEDIRQNAPMWFTTGNRLVTRFDYEYYIKNSRNSSASIGCDVVDAKCMNNWEYMASFYKWLYDLGNNGKLVEYANDLQDYRDKDLLVSDKAKYLNKSNFTRFNYFYADAADANNLYIWLKSTNDDFNVATVTATMNKNMNPIKLMTAELVACKAINVCFDICAAPVDYVLKHYLDDEYEDSQEFDNNNSSSENYIEVTLDDNALFVPSSLQKQIANIILDGFNINKCVLGQLVRYDDILNKIYELNGVLKIRTIFKSNFADVKPRIYDGLAFASWSNAGNMINIGDDVNVSNNMRHLEDFLFPVFNPNGKNLLINKIKVIKKSLSTVNTIKF